MCLCSIIFQIGNMCNVTFSTSCFSIPLWNEALSSILAVPRGKEKESKLERRFLLASFQETEHLEEFTKLIWRDVLPYYISKEAVQLWH